MIEKKKGKLVFLKTTEDYAERTSIHGIAYVFDRGLWIADRVLWAVLVLCFLGLAEEYLPRRNKTFHVDGWSCGIWVTRWGERSLRELRGDGRRAPMSSLEL